MSETKLIDVELFVAMNEEGDWVVVTDESQALTELGEQQGGYHARVVKVTVKMRPPVMTETAIEVPDEAGTEVEQPEVK